MPLCVCAARACVYTCKKSLTIVTARTTVIIAADPSRYESLQCLYESNMKNDKIYYYNVRTFNEHGDPEAGQNELDVSRRRPAATIS